LKTLNKFAIIHGSKDAVSSILEEYGFTYNYDIKYTPHQYIYDLLILLTQSLHRMLYLIGIENL